MLEAVLNAIDRLFAGRYRYLALLLLLAALGWCGYAATGLRIEDSPERWMPRSTLEAWEVFDHHFDVGDTIAVGLHFTRPVNDEDGRRIRQLRERLAAIDGMKQVYDPSLIAEIEDVSLTTLIDPENAERFALYDRALWDSPSEGKADRTLLLVCELEYLDPSDPAQIDELNRIRRRCVSEVSAVVDAARQNSSWPGVEFHMASGIVMMKELEARAARVAATFLPLSLVIGLVSLLLGFRSWRALWVALLGSAMAFLVVLGIYGSMHAALGVVTVTAPTLMSIIAIATTVHFAAYTSDHGNDWPDGRWRRHLVHWVAVPCFGAAATTAVGFLMLSFNELKPVRELGVQLFLGALAAFLGVFLITRYLPIRRARGGRLFSPDRMQHWFGRFVQAPARTTVGMLVVTGVLVFFAWPRPATERFGLHVDANPFSFFSGEQTLARSLNHFAERGFGIYQLEVVLLPKPDFRPEPSSPEAAGETQPVVQANQQAAADFIDRVMARENLGVVRVISTHSFRERQQAFLKEIARITQEEGLLAAGAKLARMWEHKEEFQNTFRAWSHDKQSEGAMRLTFACREQDAEDFAKLLGIVEQELPQDRFDCYVTGAVAQIVHLSRGLVTAMVRGLGVSLVVMAILCVVLFRSLRLALVAFLPNAFPLLAVFGAMGLMKIPISSGSAMVATVALGIALNDTIHFVLHYRGLTRDEGETISLAIDDTLRHIGRPIVLTSLVHLAGFSIFWLPDALLAPTGVQLVSGFLPLYHFGLLGCVAMIAALIGDLVLLPSLLKLFDRAPSPTSTAARSLGQAAAVRST